jgi:hypothetical protein
MMARRQIASEASPQSVKNQMPGSASLALFCPAAGGADLFYGPSKNLLHLMPGERAKRLGRSGRRERERGNGSQMINGTDLCIVGNLRGERPSTSGNSRPASSRRQKRQFGNRESSCHRD